MTKNKTINPIKNSLKSIKSLAVTNYLKLVPKFTIQLRTLKYICVLVTVAMHTQNLLMNVYM